MRSPSRDRAASRDGAAACAGFPDTLLTRSYAATIAPPASGRPLQFDMNLASMAFALSVAGDAIGFTIDGPAILEALPGYRYREITGALRRPRIRRSRTRNAFRPRPHGADKALE